MARGINKVILIGNLGSDPELRYTANGDAVCAVNLATSESWKDKASGEKQERTEWHRVVFWRQLAEILGQYTAKGSKIYIEGSLRNRKWQDNNGNDRYTTEIVVRDMQMLDSAGGRDSGSSRSSAPAASPDARRNASRAAEPADGGFEDDDIPF